MNSCIEQVGVNGIISFDHNFTLNSPENFPSIDRRVYYSYLVSPYWSDIDTRRVGRVCYEMYRRGDAEASNQRLSAVADFLHDEENVSLVAEWMFLASWESVHPFSHGDASSLIRENPYLESVSPIL